MFPVDGRVFGFVYGLVGLAAVIAIALLMPPHMNPDEGAHFNRAYQIGRGGIIAQRLSERLAGGKVDRAINESNYAMRDIPGRPQNKVTEAMIDEAEVATWGKDMSREAFANTAVYPPFFYLPSTVGILIGRGLDLSIVSTLYLSRALTGVVAVAIGSVALTFAGSAAPWLFAVLMLPTALSLSASVSQEALMHGFAALACAFAVRLFSGNGSSRVNLYGAALSLALVVMARPPLIGLALVPLAASRLSWRERLIGTAIIVVGTAAWLLLTSRAFVHPRLALDSSANPAEFGTAGQIDFMFTHPIATASAFIKTVQLYGVSVYDAFVGELGWSDVLFPSWYYTLATAMLAVAFLASLPLQDGVRLFGAAVILLGVFGAGVAIYVAQYVAWSPIGSDIMHGVQGRYFVVPALFLGLLGPGLRFPTILRVPLALATLAFPIVVTLPLMIRVIAHRYFMS